MIDTNEHGLPVIDVTGHPRVMGVLPRSRKMMASPPRLADHFALIPESQWTELDRAGAGWTIPIDDQLQYGECVGAGNKNIFRQTWIDAGGEDHDYSMSYLYSLINGGRDAGAVVSDGGAALVSQGICLTSTVPTGRIYRRQYDAAAADAEALRFRVEAVYSLSSYEEIGTALELGFRVTDGLTITRAWQTQDLDAEGAPALDFPIGGHCRAYTNARKHSAKWGWLWENANSWNTRWGLGGYCWTAKAHTHYRNNQIDGVAIKGILIDPKDPRHPVRAS